MLSLSWLSPITMKGEGFMTFIAASHQLEFVLAVLFKKLMCAPSLLYIFWFGKQLFMNDFSIYVVKKCRFTWGMLLDMQVPLLQTYNVPMCVPVLTCTKDTLVLSGGRPGRYDKTLNPAVALPLTNQLLCRGWPQDLGKRVFFSCIGIVPCDLLPVCFWSAWNANLIGAGKVAMVWGVLCLWFHLWIFFVSVLGTN